MAKITSFRTVDAATGYQVGTVHLESFQKGKSAALENKKNLKWDKPLNLLCQRCGSHFTGNKFKMFCGRICTKAAYRSEGWYYWTQEELDYMTSLIGTYSYRQIVDKFRAKFKRTQEDVTDKVLLTRLAGIVKSEGLRTKDREDNLSTQQWSESLGVSFAVISRWVRDGYIKRQDISSNLKLIKRSTMRAFALKDPFRFDDIPMDNLMWLFDGYIQPLIDAAKIAFAQARFGPLKPRAIICVETGQIFKSLEQAEKHCGVCATTIKRRIQAKQPILMPVRVHSAEKAPFHFEYYFNLLHGWGKKYV